ncbi:MAG: polynucleotide adenylyltransferase PcnB [Burkholderiales bacterium]|nr:polynucleotide adenylyltransferase PcnB [Burkholderiales bacterium]
MIKKFIDKLLGKASGAGKPRFGKREQVGPQEHGIDPSLVDDRALNVVHTLKQAGFQAYVVGGAVRDLLVGLRPKDFDVATDATPEQVKGLFRRAFIIGRRFRIVHVVYGRGREHEVIEVSTFRAHMDNAAAEQVAGNEKTSKSELAGMKHAVDSTGRVLRDNVWGPQEEDATRRDFTINAMYYDPETQIVVDYHDGIKDAKKRVIRMIGDATARYREDPVRIIRAVRFAAKLHPLGFKLDPKTGSPLLACLPLLNDVPQSRLFDEMLKLLQTGHSVATIERLKALGLSRGIYPLLDLVVERAGQPFVNAALQDTDRRVGESKPVAPSFLLACVLWADVRDGWAARLGKKQHPFPALQDAIDDVFNARIGDVSGRGKLAADMREIWMMQPRFEKRTGSTPFSLVEQPRFRAGFDFMRLRADIGEIDVVLGDWWQEFSLASDDLREDMVALLRDEQKGPRRVRVPRPPQPQGDLAGEPRQDAAAPPPAFEGGEGADSGAPKKRRRRRRKPAGEGGQPPSGSAE